MTKRYYTFIERYLPDATPEEKDEAQRVIHEFLISLLRLHAAATRDNGDRFDTVDRV